MSIKKVGVVGCGLMGHGIAQVAAQGGCSVIALETEQKFLDAGLARIDKSLAKLAEKAKEKGGSFDAPAVRARISGSLERKALADCDLVIEAIVEDLALKNQLFAELGKLCKKETIFASNTSSFPIGEMAKASGRPAQFVGLHFFNPVQLMKLVEVVRTDATSDEVFAAARAFGEACGKSPVACKDTPGFVVNRLLVPYMAEAMKMADRGDASIQDIDTAMKLGCGYPMGPFELLDVVGLDVSLAIQQVLYREFREPGFAPAPLLEHLVTAGYLGRKAGRGFRDYTAGQR
jgi:3-hydroxybutyryl-CoA dehydrogenase